MTTNFDMTEDSYMKVKTLKKFVCICAVKKVICAICLATRVIMDAGEASENAWACLQEKNVSSDLLDGKVGRIYMPRQDIDTIPLHKMKVRHRSLQVLKKYCT